MSLVEIDKLVKVCNSGPLKVTALHGISFNIEEGELVAVMGRSGSGKTTLLNVLGCVEQPTDGKYLLAGEAVADMNDSQRSALRLRRIGFVFQAYNLLSNLTALDNVLLPTVYSGISNARQRARDALARVGLTGREHHRPTEMSGGEQQRVAIARALINNPSIIFADEPTGNLDIQRGQEVLELFQELNRENITIVMVTHEEQVAEHTSRIIRLMDGYLVSDTPVEKPLDARAVLDEFMARSNHSQ